MRSKIVFRGQSEKIFSVVANRSSAFFVCAFFGLHTLFVFKEGRKIFKISKAQN